MNTIGFIAELTEARIVTDDTLWVTLNSCLEGLNEDKTDHLSIMISSVSNKQGRSRLWDRVLQTLQSRLETTLGNIFGSESPKSDGTCCSDEGFSPEAAADTPGAWDNSSQSLASMVNFVLGDSATLSRSTVPSSDAGSKNTDKDKLSTPLSQSDGTYSQSSQGSQDFPVFDHHSIFSGSLLTVSPSEKTSDASFESPHEPLMRDFLTLAGLDLAAGVDCHLFALRGAPALLLLVVPRPAES